MIFYRMWLHKNGMLAILCLLFAGVLLFKLNRLDALVIPQPTQAATASNVGFMLEDGTDKFSYPDLNTFETIIERPLFNENRKPGVAPQPVAPTKIVQKPKRKPVVNNQYLLSAVVITPKKKMAVIKNGRQRESVTLDIGESIDQWTLSEVTARTATLSNGKQSQTLELEVVSSSTNRVAKNKTNKNAEIKEQKEPARNEEKGSESLDINHDENMSQTTNR